MMQHWNSQGKPSCREGDGDNGGPSCHRCQLVVDGRQAIPQRPHAGQSKRDPVDLWLRCIALALFALPAFAEQDGTDRWVTRRAKLSQRQKKIFAHYMGCFPIGGGGISPGYAHSKQKEHRHDSANFEHAFGGRVRGVPLLPDSVNGLSKEASADLEIRRALRAGIDGFAFMAIAGGPNNVFPVMDTMFKVAEEKDYPFEITWCLSNWDRSLQAIEHILEKHGDSPKLARRDGKVLMLGYQSVFSGIDGARRVFKERYPNIRIDSPEERASPEFLRLLREGYRDLEQRFKTPMYFQFSFGALFHGMKGKPKSETNWQETIGILAEEFDAITAFHCQSGPSDYDAVARAVTARGAEWGEPLIYQYENLLWQGYRARSFPLVPGGNAVRERWERARENNSTLIQFTTWNDYHEATSLAPTTDTRYGLLDLNAYFVKWWKTGAPPEPEHDKVYLIYPKYRHELSVYPFRKRSYWRDTESMNKLEVLTILTNSARVRLPGRNEAWDAPAGLSWKQFPLSPGPVIAEVARRDKVVVRLQSPEPITEKPYREQHSMVCVSTEDERHWEADFGDADPAPMQRGEYADDDGDGLPNWFEMYWFGERFGNWASTTKAEPDADPDEDGLTNLEEFKGRSHPLVSSNYQNGYVWNFLDLGKTPYAFNPDYDDRGTPVWNYMHKYGLELPLKRDGQYWLCERFGWYPRQGYTMAKFAPPYNTPANWTPTGEFTWRWTRTESDGKRHVVPEFVMSTGPYALRVLSWRSPIQGKVKVDVSCLLAANASNPDKPATLSLEHSRPFRNLKGVTFTNKHPFALKMPDIEVERGDRLYLVLSAEPGRARNVPLKFERLSVTLTEVLNHR